MHSPPSSGLFLSSPHHYLGNGPEDEVTVLVASAQKTKALNTNLVAVIDQHKSPFLEVFGRQVQLIKSRSQAFEDAHVTVYDKVLLVLTNHGNTLETPAAIAWYCAEYLGIDITAEADKNAELIRKAVEMPHILTQGLHPPLPNSSQQAEHAQALTPSPTQKHSERTAATRFRGAIKQSSTATSKNDPTFARLRAVYSKARDEYLTVANQKDCLTLEAAKFLRDTAENGVHYLKDKHPKDFSTLAELTETYDMARSAVLALNGGRKRKFDAHERDSQGRIKRPTYPAHTLEHDRQSFEHRKREKLIPKAKRDSKSGRPRGRGPSGIPFGYTRPVDSYCPV